MSSSGCKVLLFERRIKIKPCDSLGSALPVVNQKCNKLSVIQSSWLIMWTIIVTTSTTWLIFSTDLHNTCQSVTQCKNTKSSSGFITFNLWVHPFQKSKIYPCQIWRVIDYNYCQFVPVSLSQHALTSMSTAVSCSVISNAFISCRTKMSNWAASQASQLSSRAKKKQGKKRAFCFSTEYLEILQYPQSIFLQSVWRGVHSHMHSLSMAKSTKHFSINSGEYICKSRKKKKQSPSK